jgi:riboflavin biosynthesis pyrimidine reductase
MQLIFPAGPSVPIGPVAAGSEGLATLARLYAFPPPGDRPWVRANFVSSADGAATVAGKSSGLSSETDRLIFSVLRSLADVILVGAGTARAEKYKPITGKEAWPGLRKGRSPTTPIAVITRRLDLDPESPLITGSPDSARTIVLTTGGAPAEARSAVARHADLVVTDGEMISPAAAVAALAERGHHRILLEGGPHLLGQVAAAGLLDELCLTVSPLLAGGDAGRILGSGLMGGARIPDSQASLRLGHVIEDEGFLLCRYVRQDPNR